MTGSSGTKYSAYRTILYEIKHTCTMHVYYTCIIYTSGADTGFSEGGVTARGTTKGGGG